IVLVSAGTLGLSPATSVLKRLLQMPEEFQTVVVCGKNHEMRADVEKLAAGSSKKIVTIGYTTEMPALMKTATILLSKPGGLITAEALACGLPMVVLDPIGGQEERNADVLLEKGAAIKCTEVTLIPYKLGQLLGDPRRVAAMAENARTLGFPRAAKTIVEAVMKDHRLPFIIDAKRKKALQKRANE
ncbi:MAG TPA: glycosyltransferase, partial [Chthoniobacterales bacterium]